MDLLLNTHEFTKTSASATENLNPLQTAGSSAAGAVPGGGLGVENQAREPRMEASSDTRKTAADSVAQVRNQLAEISTELSRAGGTIHRFGADFGRFWEDWSRRFLRNEATASFDPGLAPPPPIAAHGDREPGEGSAGHRPGQLAESRHQRAETVLGAPVHEAESAATAAPNSGEVITPPKPQPVAPAEAGPVVAAGKPPYATTSEELDEPPSPRTAAAGFEPAASPVPNQSAMGRAQNPADGLDQGGHLEAAQANLLVRLEQTLDGHQRTIEQAVKLIEAQSGDANYMLALLGNASQQIAAVHARLEQLEAQLGHSRNQQGGQG
jgi:hypothetical protein